MRVGALILLPREVGELDTPEMHVEYYGVNLSIDLCHICFPVYSMMIFTVGRAYLAKDGQESNVDAAW